MTFEKIEYCRDRCFPTKHIPLPLTLLLSDDLEVCVNYARTDQLPDVLGMVELAEKRGDNVGIGEFPKDSGMPDYIFNGSEIFAATDQKTKSVVAFILLHHSVYVRGYDTCLATIRVFRSASLGSNEVAYGNLVRLATDFAGRLDYGYTHVIIDVALCKTSLLKVLKSLGFLITATIPHSVNIAGVGLVENAILIKSLGLSDRPPRSSAEVLSMLKRLSPTDEFMTAYPTMQLPQIPFLPQSYTFRSGIRVILRNMRKEEDEIMFSIINESAEKGEGFGITEYPSLDYFRMHFLAGCYSVILEDVDTGAIIGFTLLSSSCYSRIGGAGEYYGGDLVLSKQFRGKRIGAELLPIEHGIARELGFTRSVHDRFISNEAMAAAIRHGGAMGILNTIVGFLPNAGYVKNVGWDDVVMECSHFLTKPTLTELVKENAKQWTSKSSKL